MKKVTAYQTEDGALFTTPKWAAKHEECLATEKWTKQERRKELRKALKNLVVNSLWFFDDSVSSGEQDAIYDSAVEFLMGSRKELRELLRK